VRKYARAHLLEGEPEVLLSKRRKMKGTVLLCIIGAPCGAGMNWQVATRIEISAEAWAGGLAPLGTRFSRLRTLC
jgi:hypothetical protein